MSAAFGASAPPPPAAAYRSWAVSAGTAILSAA